MAFGAVLSSWPKTCFPWYYVVAPSFETPPSQLLENTVPTVSKTTWLPIDVFESFLCSPKLGTLDVCACGKRQNILASIEVNDFHSDCTKTSTFLEDSKRRPEPLYEKYRGSSWLSMSHTLSSLYPTEPKAHWALPKEHNERPMCGLLRGSAPTKR